VHYFKFHIGDFRGATSHLSNAEELAYRRLIDWYYDTEQHIPLDTQWVSRRLRVDEKDLIQVLNDFFVSCSDGWSHARCDQEIEDYHHQLTKNRQNGAKGGRPSLKNNPLGFQSDPSGIPVETHIKGSHEPLTINHKPITNEDTPRKRDDLFNKFWKAYPKKVGKDAAQKAFDKRKPDESLTDKMIEVVESWKSREEWSNIKFIPHPATWLNEGRWKDDEGQTVSAMPDWMRGAI